MEAEAIRKPPMSNDEMVELIQVLQRDKQLILSGIIIGMLATSGPDTVSEDKVPAAV